jgi:hypothetical protein
MDKNISTMPVPTNVKGVVNVGTLSAGVDLGSLISSFSRINLKLNRLAR